MKTINAMNGLEVISKELLNNESLLIVGSAGTGKTFFLKEWISAYSSEKSSSKQIGTICLPNERCEFEPLSKEVKELTFYEMDLENKVPNDEMNLELLSAFIKDKDVLIIDESRLTIGDGEMLHQLLDLCEDKVVLAVYQSLDQISTSKVYIKTVMKRFNKQIFFKIPKSFSSEFILGKEKAQVASELSRTGTVLIVEEMGNIQ